MATQGCELFGGTPRLAACLGNDPPALEESQVRLGIADIYGQETVVSVLQNAAATDRLAHAYLFYGPRGTGKTTISASIADALGRKFVRIPFGGMSSALELRGQARVFGDAEPGQPRVRVPGEDPHAGLAKGKLAFSLDGEKLHGAWELIRTGKPGERQTRWLLFKKRDAYERPEAEYDVVSALPDSVQLGNVLVLR